MQSKTMTPTWQARICQLSTVPPGVDIFTGTYVWVISKLDGLEWLIFIPGQNAKSGISERSPKT